MAEVKFGISSTSKPAPKAWRRFERAMLIAFLPAAITIVQQWKFKDEVTALKIQLMVSVGAVALIKGIGMLLSNGDEYSPSAPTVIEQQKN